jgi:sortase A
VIRARRRAQIRAGLVALLACAALVQFAAAAWIHAKAAVAQVLLRDAWARTQGDGRAHPPWPWADIVPVARLAVPRLGVDLIVLEGFSGEALAFGPGLVPAGDDTIVLSAHRDTHFAFLRDVEADERLLLEQPGHPVRAYRLRELRVIDYRDAGALLAAAPGTLVLVTCWPLDAAAPGGPLRFVALAEREVVFEPG